MLDLADPLDRIESPSSSTEEIRHDRFVCDLEHNIQVESPHAVDRVHLTHAIAAAEIGCHMPMEGRAGPQSQVKEACTPL